MIIAGHQTLTQSSSVVYNTVLILINMILEFAVFGPLNLKLNLKFNVQLDLFEIYLIELIRSTQLSLKVNRSV